VYATPFLNLIDGFNKIAILTNKGIEMFGQNWTEKDGISYSNNHFMPVIQTIYPKTEWQKDQERKEKEKETKSCITIINSEKNIEGNLMTDLTKNLTREQKETLLNEDNASLEKHELDAKYELLHTVLYSREKRQNQLEENMRIMTHPKGIRKIGRKLQELKSEIICINQDIIDCIDQTVKKHDKISRIENYNEYTNEYYDNQIGGMY